MNASTSAPPSCLRLVDPRRSPDRGRARPPGIKVPDRARRDGHRGVGRGRRGRGRDRGWTVNEIEINWPSGSRERTASLGSAAYAMRRPSPYERRAVARRPHVGRDAHGYRCHAGGLRASRRHGSREAATPDLRVLTDTEAPQTHEPHRAPASLRPSARIHWVLSGTKDRQPFACRGLIPPALELTRCRSVSISF